MKKNVLGKTRCYLAGGMQYVDDGKLWREKVEGELGNRGITFFNPYKKPFIDDIPEDDVSRAEMLHWMHTEQYDLVRSRMKKVRQCDLRIVDISDWFICVVSPETASWGTAEELSVMVRERKPIFLVIDHPMGKKKTPLWIMSQIEHKFIYNNVDEAIDTIKAIDDNVVKLTSDRWKLLKPYLR